MNYVKISTVNKILNLEIDDKSSFDEVKSALLEIKNELSEALELRKNKSHEIYSKSNLSEKRKLKFIANSKSYIRKNWLNRKNKKELILNHIKKIREVDTMIFSDSPAIKKKVHLYKKDENKILELYLKKNSLQKIIDFLGYGTKQSLSSFLKKHTSRGEMNK